MTGRPEDGGEPGTVARAAAEAPESTLPDDAPRIHLPVFEGPLDLLLYLIRKNEIDIHDIPIAPITRQYMEYLELMRELNLDVAGEFMVMAATLIHIKSKMLVPVDPTEAEGEAQEDPREALVQRLLEFQRYKDAAGVLHQKGQIRAATWTRPAAALPVFDDAGEEILEAGLFDLIAAFKDLLERRKTLLAHEVEDPGKSVDQRMSELLDLILEGQSLELLELFAELQTKGEMILTFLALLELIRLKRVKVYQRALFGAIRVFRPVGPEPAPARPAIGDMEEQKPDETGAEAASGEAAAVLPASEVRAVVEALVFASPQPLTPREIEKVLGGVPRRDWQAALDEIRADYARDGRGLQLVEVAGGFQITTRPEYNDWVRELLDPKAPTRLSVQALETLAVIAYKQPVTLPEIIDLRGVKSGGVLKTLLEKRLIRITGRKEVVGRPMLYGTTKEFLLHFGLKDVGELPRIEEFAAVLGDDVDVDGLRRAIEAPRPVETSLAEEEPAAEGGPEGQAADEEDLKQDLK